MSWDKEYHCDDAIVLFRNAKVVIRKIVINSSDHNQGAFDATRLAFEQLVPTLLIKHIRQLG